MIYLYMEPCEAVRNEEIPKVAMSIDVLDEKLRTRFKMYKSFPNQKSALDFIRTRKAALDEMTNLLAQGE